MSWTLVPRLIADLFDVRARRSSRKYTWLLILGVNRYSRSHLSPARNRNETWKRIEAVVHAPPDRAEWGMVYLPGAINVADIMDSVLSYGLIFLRNYSTLLRKRERGRERKDSIAERSRLYKGAFMRRTIFPCDFPPFLRDVRI